mmetsp:Transcript_33295/g.54099  ORF Transcript_33295/g.54099 Transcript_33295/m.54099 type:complete len:116 (+) Transcript_33295:89-436(+)
MHDNQFDSFYRYMAPGMRFHFDIDTPSFAFSAKKTFVPRTTADVRASEWEIDVASASIPNPIGPTRNAKSPACLVRDKTEPFCDSGARSTVKAVKPGVSSEFPTPHRTTAARNGA